MIDQQQQQILDPGWTYSSLERFVQRQLDDMRDFLKERYETQTKALDKAFMAAETAVQTALLSAEKAVTKAEVAAEKRFEAVNEFRGQLADQTNTFIPRVEHDLSLKALDDKTGATLLAMSDRITSLDMRLSAASREQTSRLDLAQGTKDNSNAVFGFVIAAIIAASAIVGTIVALVP